jgi:hypothetical protein
MTNDDGTTCAWSDLPTDQCAHCRGGQIGWFRIAHPVAAQDPVSRPPRRPVTGRQLPESDTRYWELTDFVTALCDTTRASQTYQTCIHNADGTLTWVTERHHTVSPPLLEQLWSAAEQSGSVESGRRVLASKPSARIDAIDTAVRIENEVHALLTARGVTDSHDRYPDTIAAVRHLGSIAGTDRDAYRSIRSWWAAARIVTGWDSPAWAPDNTCPLCAVRGGLRIRLDLHTGLCIECHETWDENSIGLLADHIRAENHEDEQADEVDADTPQHRAC